VSGEMKRPQFGVLIMDYSTGPMTQEVRRTDACQDLALSEDDIYDISLALCRYEFGLKCTLDDRSLSQRRNQQRRINATRNSVEDASQHIRKLLDDSALRDAVFSAYTPPGPDEVRYIPWAEHPADVEHALVETCLRLEGLFNALDKLEAQDSPYPATKVGTAKAQARLIASIAATLELYAGDSKSLLADYIGDFLELVDVDITHKSILNHLSQIR